MYLAAALVAFVCIILAGVFAGYRYATRRRGRQQSAGWYVVTFVIPGIVVAVSAVIIAFYMDYRKRSPKTPTPELISQQTEQVQSTGSVGQQTEQEEVHMCFDLDQSPYPCNPKTGSPVGTPTQTPPLLQCLTAYFCERS